MSIIDALKRLERAGSEDSRASEKLRQAANELGRYVAGKLPWPPQEATDIPRSYTVGGSPNAPFLVSPVQEGDGYWPVRYGLGIDQISRTAAMQLAEDVASGWLDELATWLESRVGTSEQAAAMLAAAKEQLS